MLNNIVGYVLGYKALAENRLRQSKLNYMVIRPGRLTDNLQDKEVRIYQGDNKSGEISRDNLAKLVVNAIGNKDINKNKVTFEVVEDSRSSQFGVKFDTVKVDDESSVIKADHFKATITMNAIVGAVLLLVLMGFILRYK
jgi:hypothetical protein